MFTSQARCATLWIILARATQVLVVGGDLPLADRIRARLADRGYEVEILRSGPDCVRRFSAQGAELVIASLPLQTGGGAELLGALRDVDARLKVVVTGRDEQIRDAAAAFRLGAFEYVDASADLGELLAAVGGALGSRRGDMQLRWLKERDADGASWTSIAGTSAEMREVVDTVRRVCERTTRGAAPTILVRGETGSGKGLLARCIHYNGVRRNQAFVEINCAALPAALLESELFGYERGAFTDAKTSRPGLFETAHQGTLFLDEIGSLPIDLQAKLLTSIEEKRIRRLGGRDIIHLDIQIIAASHNDLKENIRTGAFRADLYHRLNVVSVTLPPLRRRGNDKLILARMFVESMCRQYGIAVPRLTEDAESYILEYAWPGNVREMKNQIERIVLLGNGESISRRNFDQGSSAPPPPSGRGLELSFQLPQLPEEGVGLDEVERELIRRALDRFSGNVSRAARYLKVSRQTLIYRIKKHRLE
jgi:two-component system response regulator AtoC